MYLGLNQRRSFTSRIRHIAIVTGSALYLSDGYMNLALIKKTPELKVDELKVDE